MRRRSGRLRVDVPLPAPLRKLLEARADLHGKPLAEEARRLMLRGLAVERGEYREP